MQNGGDDRWLSKLPRDVLDSVASRMYFSPGSEPVSSLPLEVGAIHLFVIIILMCCFPRSLCKKSYSVLFLTMFDLVIVCPFLDRFLFAGLNSQKNTETRAEPACRDPAELPRSLLHRFVKASPKARSSRQCFCRFVPLVDEIHDREKRRTVSQDRNILNASHLLNLNLAQHVPGRLQAAEKIHRSQHMDEEGAERMSTHLMNGDEVIHESR